MQNRGQGRLSSESLGSRVWGDGLEGCRNGQSRISCWREAFGGRFLGCPTSSADPLRELLLDHSGVAVALLVLDVSTACIEFCRVDRLRNKVAIGLPVAAYLG